MRLAVFGAASPTGQLIAKQALDTGYQVTALLKSGQKVPAALRGAGVVQGGPQEDRAILSTLKSAHAVISVLDADEHADDIGNARALLAIIAGMQSQGIKRLVLYADTKQPHIILPEKEGFFAQFLKKAGLSKPQVVTPVDIARASGLDWTVVHSTKPSDIPSGKLSIGTLIETTNRAISHSDLAKFMLSQVTDVSYLHKSPAINSN